MPVAVMMIVGGPDGAGAGAGAGALTGGVGAVGVVVDAPLEHAATAINDRTLMQIGTRHHLSSSDAVSHSRRRIDAGGRTRTRVKLPYHDCRSVVIGSTDAARCAGRKQAMSATTLNSAGTAMKVNGSSVPTP